MSLSLPALSQSDLDLWQASEGDPAGEMIRLTLLRNFERSLHAAHSSASTSQNSSTLRKQLELLDEAILRARNLSPLPHSFEDLLSGSLEVSATSPRRLPESLFNDFSRDKLMRYDRAWEREILAAALTIGGGLWSYEESIAIAESDRYQTALEARIRPDASVLFVETVEFHDRDWRGRWLLAARPGIDWKTHGFQPTSLPELLFVDSVG